MELGHQWLSGAFRPSHITLPCLKEDCERLLATSFRCNIFAAIYAAFGKLNLSMYVAVFAVVSSATALRTMQIPVQ